MENEVRVFTVGRNETGKTIYQSLHLAVSIRAWGDLYNCKPWCNPSHPLGKAKL
jgi:hypothetical protein